MRMKGNVYRLMFLCAIMLLISSAMPLQGMRCALRAGGAMRTALIRPRVLLPQISSSMVHSKIVRKFTV